jgi:NAD(P)-dependent dehydrogenase (short-subunit alcohol dehydrogenase family)
MHVAQSLIRKNVTAPVQIAVLSTGLHSVTGTEVVSPAKATLLGACKSIPQEYQNLRCRSIDLVLPAAAERWRDELVEGLLGELDQAPDETVLAYRQGERLAQEFEPVRLTADGSTLLRAGGVYLITGGLGNICLALAEELARTARAKLVLIGRSSFPAREDWAQWLQTHEPRHRVSSRIRRLQAIEALGAQIMVQSADVADEEQMRRVLDRIHADFGALHGVIHAAGTIAPESFFGIDQAQRNGCELHFKPKIRGLFVLEKLLRDQSLDFWFLTSSLSSILAGIGFMAYAATNAFLDAFAVARNRQGRGPWFSVNWDNWTFAEHTDGSVDANLAMLPHEGVETFRRILVRDSLPRVAVSTTPLRSRIDQWINFKSAGAAGATDSGTLHPRPELATEHVWPRNDVEKTIASIWQELLGIAQIGVHDNFFELGGQSLLATQIVARLRAAFQTDLPLRRFFEGPTVNELALAISNGAKDNSGSSPAGPETAPALSA